MRALKVNSYLQSVRRQHERDHAMAKIGVIGSGNIGGALARLFTKAGTA